MKINIGKMRRHAARATPDVISRTFSRYEDNEMAIELWKRRFGRDMEIKYSGKRPWITMHLNDTTDLSKIKITMECSPPVPYEPHDDAWRKQTEAYLRNQAPAPWKDGFVKEYHSMPWPET